MRRLDPQRFAGQIGGCEVGLYTLRSPQIEASWCNHGARLLQLIVPDREGRLRDVVLGHDSLEQLLSGMASMIIAQLLSQGGDTLEMLQAVLDTNFWLATHVTIVTLGYTATFVAGFLGAAYIFAGMFTNALRKDGGRAIYQMTYGTVCFATLLSFVGTVLGGIWADQSWGRFWGWDPKENGAVLIVIWNALALHARWSGIVKSRGFAVLAVFGNIVTAWSWFGTNQLGIGLHAYGFNKQLADSCAIFWVSQVLIMALGAVPLPLWASFGPEPEEPKKTK